MSGQGWKPGMEVPATGLALPVCRDCGTVQYPPRELCRQCLGVNLDVRPVQNRGRLLSWTALRASLDPYFREQLPWPVGLVQLEAGPVLYAHLALPEPGSGAEVEIHEHPDVNGKRALIAVPPGPATKKGH